MPFLSRLGCALRSDVLGSYNLCPRKEGRNFFRCNSISRFGAMGHGTSNTTLLAEIKTGVNSGSVVRYDGEIEDEDFVEQFNWLIGPLQHDLFDGIEKFLLFEEKFINNHGKRFKNEVCGLVALEKLKKISMKKEVRNVYLFNLFKYKKYNTLMKLITDKVSPMIKKEIEAKNLTKAEISSACEDQELKRIKEAMILSNSFLFHYKSLDKQVGAGDIAVSKFPNGLSQKSKFYKVNHEQFSKIFSEMVGESIPGSIFETPKFFVNPDPDKITFEYNLFILSIKKDLKFLNIPFETLRNYHFLWYTYNSPKISQFTMFCKHHNGNCSDPSNYIFPLTKQKFELLNNIRKNPGQGVLIEANVTKPPCLDHELKEKMKIGQICDLLIDSTTNKVIQCRQGL